MSDTAQQGIFMWDEKNAPDTNALQKYPPGFTVQERRNWFDNDPINLIGHTLLEDEEEDQDIISDDMEVSMEDARKAAQHKKEWRKLMNSRKQYHRKRGKK